MAFFLFLVWTFVIFARPQDFFLFLHPLRPALLLTASILLVSFFNSKIIFLQLSKNHQLVKRYYFLYFIMIVGVPFSIHTGNSIDFVVFNYLNNILYFSFLIIYIDSLEKLSKFLFILCLANCFYAGLSILNSGPLSGRFSFGNMYDPNDLAYFLISLFPLSFYFLSAKGTGAKRIIAAVTIILSLAVTFMTGSRGGILGLSILVFFLFFTRLSPFKFIYKFLLLTVFVVALSVNIDKIDTDRFSSILNPEEDYNVKSEEGRLAVWKKGWELTLRHPITGVGANSFHNAIGSYRKELGEVPRWQAPHNSFIQVLTELGFPGFFVFFIIIASALKTFFGYARQKLSNSHANNQFILMSRVMLLAFLGNLVTSFFLSMAYSIILTLFLAFSVVLQRVHGSINTPETSESQSDG